MSDLGRGSGSELPLSLLLINLVTSTIATCLSFYSIGLQVKNYRKPLLQRHVVRILVMVPIYAMASLISLYSLSLAFFIDAVRDVYEAFVIYSFFQLLSSYLGGERSLLIMAHGRDPVKHPRPFGWILPPMDISDPFTFLSVKRGILQFIYVKPFLAILTMVLKTFDKYDEGSFKPGTGYFWISLVYNISVALSLYALAMFWLATHDDLVPFRPVPKFLCVKGIIFFSFWQGFLISILVAVGWIHATANFSSDNLSLALQDMLICLEMPLFALLHLYAFSHTDYLDPTTDLVARMPATHAFKDAFGMKDVLIDSQNAFKGTGFSYRTFEPAEGQMMHAEGFTRDKRVKAGLRYAKGGKQKYWIPIPDSEAPPHSSEEIQAEIASENGYTARRDGQHGREVEGGDADHLSAYPGLLHAPANAGLLFDPSKAHYGTMDKAHGPVERDGDLAAMTDQTDPELAELAFDAPDDLDDKLFQDSRRLVHGDFNYPVIDTGQEEKRRQRRKGKERRPVDSVPAKDHRPLSEHLPEGCVDVIVKQKDSHAINPKLSSTAAAFHETPGYGKLPRTVRSELHGDVAGTDHGEDLNEVRYSVTDSSQWNM